MNTPQIPQPPTHPAPDPNRPDARRDKGAPPNIHRQMRTSRWAIPALLILATACDVIAPLVPQNISRLFYANEPGAVDTGRFSPVQIDPRSEDSAGPQFVVSGDLDGDGLIDLVTAWNESNPIQIHLQRHVNGDTVFETITLAGGTPIVVVAGLAVEDMNGDGRNDIVVLVKDTGEFARCRTTGEIIPESATIAGLIAIFFGPDDPADVINPFAWEAVELNQSKTAGIGPADPLNPELGGYTSMAIADIDLANGPDIVVAWNAAECEAAGNRVDYFTNPGPATVRQANAWSVTTVEEDVNFPVKSVAAFDVDGDGDPDIVSTYPQARTRNVRWRRNPLNDVPDPFHVSDGTWQRGTVGQIATGADIITTGDIDGDGRTDIVVRSSNGMVVQWFRGPSNPTTDPVRNVPWQIFTIAEFTQRTPQAITLTDLDGDGQLELVVSAQGALLWFEPDPDATVFDQWNEFLIIDDSPPEQATPPVTDPNVDPDAIDTPTTLINSVLGVDLQNDGLADIIATLDRQGQSGLTNDALIWYRNNGP